MEPVLQALYYGRYIPYENIAPKDNSKYKAVNAKVNKEKEFFKSLLSSENYGMLEKLETLYSESADIELEYAYIAGFRLAVKIMAEVYSDKENLPKIEKLIEMLEKGAV